MKPALYTSIPEAINNSYSEAMRYCDGYLVIGRDRLIKWIDLGAQRILKVVRDDAINSSLIPFLPTEIRPMHDKWVNIEFKKIDDAIKSNAEYSGRYMAAEEGGTRAKYIDAIDGEGSPISIGIEFVPLAWLNGENTEIGIAAFINLNPEQAVNERLITQKTEAQEVIRIAKADTAILYAEKAGSIFARLYEWIKLNALSSWQNFLAFSFTSIIVIFVLGSSAYTTWFIFFRKGPSINEIHINPDSGTNSTGLKN